MFLDSFFSNLNNKIPLSFGTVALCNDQDIKKYVIEYCNINQVDLPYAKFKSNIKHIGRPNLVESKEFNEIKPFVDTLKFLDSLTNIKVGDKFAVISAEIFFAWKEILLSGFTEPKEVTKIKTNSDGSIAYIMFADGDRYPRQTPATYSGKPINIAAYFGSGNDAKRALTMLHLKVPNGWEVDSTDLTKRKLTQQQNVEDTCRVCGQTPCNCTHISEDAGAEKKIAALEKKIDTKQGQLEMARERRKMSGKSKGVQGQREVKLGSEISKLRQELHILKQSTKQQTVSESVTTEMRVWAELQHLSLNDRAELFESICLYPTNINENIESADQQYFVELGKYAARPHEGTQYVCALLAFTNNRVIVMNPVEVLTFIAKTGNEYILQRRSGGTVTFPSELIRNAAIYKAFMFNNKQKYNQFRSAIAIKFTTNLPVWPGDNNMLATDIAENSNSTKKFKVTYDMYGSNSEKPLYTKSHNVYANSEQEAIATVKQLVGGRSHRAELINEAFPYDVDHMPGQTKKFVNTNCTTCHGRKIMYKLNGELYADNRVGAVKVKCPTCKGTGDKLAEAKSLTKRVRVVKGPHAGKTGWIRQIQHGAFKGAPKSYFVDLDDGGQADNLPASALRLIKDIEEDRVTPKKPPRRGTLAWEIAQQRKQQEQDPEHQKFIASLGNKDHMYGTAKVIHKDVDEATFAGRVPATRLTPGDSVKHPLLSKVGIVKKVTATGVYVEGPDGKIYNFDPSSLKLANIHEELTATTRIEHILQKLRASHPEARDDLEALLLSFEKTQSQDRKDISRLDAENDAEEADIADLENEVDQIEYSLLTNEDWQKVNKQDKTDGMSKKAVDSYRKENPGSKLNTAVTTDPSKLKKGSKASKRRSSYCSRSKGQMDMHNISCANTPDKAICKARRRWNCESVAEAAGLYGPYVVTINTGERPQSRIKTKKFRREDDAILWAEDWLEDFPQYVYATIEITDPEGNVVWYSDETMIHGQPVAEGYDNINALIQKLEDMSELIFQLPPSSKKNKLMDKRDELEANIETMPGGKEALRRWAHEYNDSFDESVAEGLKEATVIGKKPTNGSLWGQALTVAESKVRGHKSVMVEWADKWYRAHGGRWTAK
jgi:hypothetical protein